MTTRFVLRKNAIILVLDAQPTEEMAKNVKMNASGRKWISHAQKNPFVSNMLLPKNQPRKLARSTPIKPLGTP